MGPKTHYLGGFKPGEFRVYRFRVLLSGLWGLGFRVCDVAAKLREAHWKHSKLRSHLRKTGALLEDLK